MLVTALSTQGHVTLLPSCLLEQHLCEQRYEQLLRMCGGSNSHAEVMPVNLCRKMLAGSHDLRGLHKNTSNVDVVAFCCWGRGTSQKLIVLPCFSW